ncbi:hypothetical protein [Methylobacterium sp. CM6247]
MAEPYSGEDDEGRGYLLEADCVPACHTGDGWVNYLRWLIAVMDAADKDLGFIASLLSHVAEKGGLIEKQGKYATRTVDRVRAQWMSGSLDCQQAPVPPETLGFASMTPEGNA